MATNTGSTGTITFDELFAKLENSRLTINHYKLITAAVLGDMLEFFDYFIIGFVLAFIVVPWKLSFGQTAIVLLSAGVGSLLGSFYFGWLADRMGRLKVCIITIFTFSVPAGLLYFTPEGNWIFLTVLRFVVGFGVGGLYSVDLPLVQEFVPTRHRGVIGGIVTALIPAGTLLGSVCAAFLTPIIGWRGLFLIGLIPAVLALIFRFWMRESPRYLISRGRYKDAVKSINWILQENYDPDKVVLGPSAGKLKAAPKFKEIFKYPRSVAVTWMVSFIQSIMDYGFVLWAPTLLMLVLKIPGTQASKMFIAVAFSSIIGKFFWAFLGEVVGRRVAGMLIGLGSIVTCLIVANFWSATLAGWPVIYLSFIAIYFFINGGWSITGPYSTEIWPQRLRGTGMGSAYGIGGIGRIFGPMILALFAGQTNLVTPKATINAIGPAWTFFACCGAVMVVTYFFCQETRNKTVAEIEKMLGAPEKEAAAEAGD
ncbi:MAG: MFS transporter [Candidatus Korobacteraceae bacterium]|jgi:putative MFS transporter